MVTGEQILKAEKPGDIFSNDSRKIRTEYRNLVKKYHPDVCGRRDADDILQKLTELYNEGCRAISEDTWEKSNFIRIRKAGSGAVEITFQDVKTFELGTVYVCSTHVVYLFDEGKKKYGENMVKRTASLKYRDSEMEKVFRRCMPDITSTFDTADGRYCVVLKKTKDVFPLSDVLAFLGGKMDPRHVAWCMSRLHNLSCFLKYNGTVMNGLTVDNCYVSPKYHSICLFGGWWYATGEKEKMTGTAKEVFDIMPATSKTSKTAEYTTDLESIKLIGRKLAGNANSRILKAENTVPAPILDFITGGSGKDPVKEFQKWDRVLNDAYGVRKFIPLNITEKNLYH